VSGVESTNRQSGIGRLGRGAAGRVQVIPHGPLPFAVGSTVWRDARGALVCTVVAKASYELAPGQCSLLKDPVALQEADGHWDNAPTKSVHIPGDLAPFKSAPEVVVVGSVFAPAERPVQSITARIVVGSVDKPVEVWAPRQFRRDGAIEGASRIARFSLRYEHAAGGPETDNPVGLDCSRTDAWGRIPIPQILPPFYELKRPGDYIPIAGLGPLASSWPPRALRLREQDRAWLARPSEAPLPPGFSAKFFQVAPPDQWLDRPLAANERLVLESLHAEVPRLVTNLPGIEPWMFVVESRGEPLRLQGDLLVIETDQALATLTFRGQIPLDEGSSNLTVLVIGTPLGTAPTIDTVRSFLDLDTNDGYRLTGSGSAADPSPEAQDEVELSLHDVESAVHERTSTDDPFWEVTDVSQSPAHARSALPFKPATPSRSAPSHAAPPVAASPPPPPPVSPPPLTPPPVAPALVAPPPVAPLPVVAPPIGVPSLGASTPFAPLTPAPVPWNMEPSREPARPDRAPMPSLSAMPHPDPIAPSTIPRDLSSQASHRDATSTPQRPADASKGFESAFGSSKASTDTSAKAFDAAFGGAKPAPVVPAKGFDATFGSVRAASDAAAKKEASQERANRDASSRTEKQPPRRHAVVDLLYFDAKIAPRLRTMPRFADVWTLPSKPRVQGVDAARTADEPDRDRMTVLRVLSCGRVAEASEIRGALAESLEDVTDFDLPLVLVAGELRPSFDEVETLRATVAAAQLVAKSDKKVVPALTIAQEALAGPAPRPDTALSLTRQIEQAAASLSLPPRYIPAQVERVLLEERKFKRRTLLGSPRVRAEIAMPGSSEVFLIYLPDAPSASLPLLPGWPALALCEVRPREDIAETLSEALVAVAFGRVLHSRYESSTG
jgi:hypothetical protein